MRHRSRITSLGLLLPLLFAAPAGSQYLYLDTNGNGVRDAEDRLADEGPTTIDVWIVTDRNRDGSEVVCDQLSNTGNTYGMTINSYSFVLHAVGGTMRWGPMDNLLPFSELPPAHFAIYSDTTDPVYYHNGWGGADKFPPGPHRVARLTVEPLSGTPSLFVEPFLPGGPWQITQFGTSCPGLEWDNTFKLGAEWNDADGLGSVLADAGGPYSGKELRAIVFEGGSSRSPDGSTLTYLWDFGDGSSAAGSTVSHAYATPGNYQATLTVSTPSSLDTDVTEVHIVEAPAPIADAGGPYATYIGYAVTVDGRSSHDPDGDAIVSYVWEFGDGSGASGSVASHVYGTAGSFTARLTVSNGSRSDTDEASVTVRPAPHAPVAAAGGPYHGIAGRIVAFFGGATSDADGDPLSYLWHFGDQTTGTGVTPKHTYEASGEYEVRLVVSDGFLTDDDLTTASIAPALAARAFVESGTATISLANPAPLTIRIEPSGGSFELWEVEEIVMGSAGTGSRTEITASTGALFADSDGNQVDELSATFQPGDLALLFDGVDQETLVTTIIRGHLVNGGSYSTTLALLVVPPPTSVPVRISPNPFNPVATVTFSLASPGTVRADLFDVHGRRVRTVIDAAPLAAGPHRFKLDARGSEGRNLASGIYFFRMTGPDGTTTTRRVAIAK